MRYTRPLAVALCLATAALLSACQGSPSVQPLDPAQESQYTSTPVVVTPPAERQTASPSASATPSAKPSASPSALPSVSASATKPAETAPQDPGSEASATAPAPAPVKPTKAPTRPVPNDPAPVNPPPAGSGGADYPGVVDLINQRRKAAGLKVLPRNASVAASAVKCSQSNIAASLKAGSLQLSHSLSGCGYENLFGASYKMTAQEIVDGWMDSPGHKAAILNPDVKSIGVGYATGGEFFVIAAGFGF